MPGISSKLKQTSSCTSHDRVPTAYTTRQSLPLSTWFILITLWSVACPRSASAQAPRASAARASDQVFYRRGPTSTEILDPWVAPASEVFLGRVLDFDANALTIELDDGTPKRLTSRHVQRVDFAWSTQAAAEADKLFHKREYRAAIRSIAACYKDLPKWQQRILIARMVSAFTGLGLHRQAGIFFLNLSAESPPAMLYSEMPLSWTPVAPDRELLAAAKGWLESEDPHARLLGASWLLTGAQRGAAETALRELRGSKNATLAELATFQSLRLLPPNRIQATFSQRMAQTDALLTPLQLGPLLTAADQMRTQNQTDVAIGLWTRIATQCEPHYHFGATALGACVKQLGLEQRTDQVDAINKWSERFQAKQTSN